MTRDARTPPPTREESTACPDPHSRGGATSAAERRHPGAHAWSLAWPVLFWALWGAWLAALDLRQDDAQPAALLLVVGSTVLAAARPRHAVWFALALAAWIPAEPLVARATGLVPLTPPNVGSWLLPPIPALIGAGVGVALHRAFHRPRL